MPTYRVYIFYIRKICAQFNFPLLGILQSLINYFMLNNQVAKFKN